MCGCKEESCCSEKSCCEESSCCSSNSCSEGSCSSSGCESECSTGCSMCDMTLKIANEAWAELLKEKMKKHYEAKTGKKMDAIAAVAVDGAMAYWAAKMEAKAQMMENMAKCEEFKGKMRAAFQQ